MVHDHFVDSVVFPFFSAHFFPFQHMINTAVLIENHFRIKEPSTELDYIEAALVQMPLVPASARALAC